MVETRTVFKSGVSASIYTNTSRLIKGNTVRDKFLVMADSVLFFSDANTPDGFLYIDPSTANVDVSFIKSTSPASKFLRDDGTWADLTSSPLTGTFLFVSGNGIDTETSSGTNVLSIGCGNANVINYGNSSTVHNFLGTAIYELQVNSYVQDKVITLNYDGSVASAAGVGFEIQEASSITGFFKTNAARNGFSLKSPAISSIVDLDTNLLTSDRVFSFPDVSGKFIVGDLADYGIAFGSAGGILSSTDFLFDPDSSELSLNGNFAAGGSHTPTAFIDIAPANSSTASLRIRVATDTPTSPNDGDIWQDGSRIFIFIAGAVRSFTLE